MSWGIGPSGKVRSSRLAKRAADAAEAAGKAAGKAPDKPPALKGTQNPETAWATKTGRAYDRRFREFWRKFEGETIGDGIEVASVNRRLAEGIPFPY